jgi:hypothetical protein
MKPRIGGSNCVDAEVWDECQNPERMIRALAGNLDLSKLQLFSVASCRRVWDLQSSERLERLREVCAPLGLKLIWPPLRPSPCHLAIEAAERHAKRLCDVREWNEVGRNCALVWTEAAAHYEHHCSHSQSWDLEARITGHAVRAAWYAGAAHPMHGAETARSVADTVAYLRSRDSRPDMDAFDAEFAAQAELLRRIYGNPFRGG